MILCACNTIDEAKGYIKRMSLTSEQVKISTKDDAVFVITRQWGVLPW